MEQKPIFDIFSRKKGKPKEKIKIIADYREKNSLVFSYLINHGVKVEQRVLPVADFLVDNIAIERKTVSDFISSIINKRIFKQLEELKQYEKYFLIIEGIEEQELYNDSGEWVGGSNPNAIRGMILSIILKYQVPVLFTKNAEDTAKFIYVLAKKQKISEHSFRPNKRILNIEEQKQFILEGFPGIGPKTAKKLLDKFQSLENIFSATEEELKEILGIKSKNFKQLLQAPDSE